MRILFIAEWFLPDVGGSINWYSNVYKRLKNNDIFVLTKKTEGWKEFDEKKLFKTYRISFKGHWFTKPESLFIYIKLFLYSFWIILAKRIELIHCDKVMPTGLVGWILDKIFRIPYIVYAHGEEIGIYSKYASKRKLMPIIYNSAKNIIANSSFTKNLLIGLGVKEGRIVVIHPGVDIEKFSPSVDSNEIAWKHNLAQKQVLLTIGRLETRKGHDIIIRLMPELIQKFPNILYLIAGKGPQEQYLRELIDKLGLQDYVKLAGMISDDDLPRYYSACDIFIMPNRELQNGHVEGFGIVFVEANACGKPVIGGITGGTSDSIIEGETGLKVDPVDTESLNNAIIKLLENKEYAKSLGDNGRNRVVNNFDYDIIAKKIKELSSMVAS